MEESRFEKLELLVKLVNFVLLPEQELIKAFIILFLAFRRILLDFFNCIYIFLVQLRLVQLFEVLELILIRWTNFLLLNFKQLVKVFSRDSGLLLDLPQFLGHHDMPLALRGVLVFILFYREVFLLRLLYLDILRLVKFALYCLVTRYVKVELLLLEMQNHRNSLNEIMINILV